MYCCRKCMYVGQMHTPDDFWVYVNKDGPIPPHRPELGPCWVWTGNIHEGYGRAIIGKKQYRAHRLAWTLTCGPIPEGKHACHKCDNPTCVRPDHIFLGTQKENVADMIQKGRAYTGKMTQSHAIEIRRRYAAGGVTHMQLAAEYDVSRGTISKILRHLTWMRVP